MTVLRLLFLFVVALPSITAHAAAVTVDNLRQWRAPDHTRLVFDLSGPLAHRLFALKNPERIVIDLDNARLREPLPQLDSGGPVLAAVRTGQREDGTLRIVLDLKKEARPRTFVLKPAGEYGHRLVIDLYDAGVEEYSNEADDRLARTRASSTATTRSVRRDAVVAIDAGHGGEDPGAIGRRYRTREKNVTLAVARELAKLVNAAPGMRALLIRDGDYYIGLRDRYRKARRHQADIFISIHADALPGRQAHGSSIYALSEKGASDAMTKFLADKENASDLVGGVSLNDKDDLLAKVLVDLSQTKSIHDSLSLGEDILAELRHVGPIHFDRVRQAGFTVLKAPDIPSVLIETAFISNPSEEKKLRTVGFQRRLARGIFKGITRFSAHSGLGKPHPVVAAAPAAPQRMRQHVVKKGETLTSIADKYDIRVEVLRFANNLTSDELTIGRRLNIP